MAREETASKFIPISDALMEVLESGVLKETRSNSGEKDSLGEEGDFHFVSAIPRPHGDCDKLYVYSYKGTLLADQVLCFAQVLANVYGDELVAEMWVELDGRHPAAEAMGHGFTEVGLISPGERSYEANVLIGAARTVWFELRNTRAKIWFEFAFQLVIVEEFEHQFPDCKNGNSCNWLYFEDGEGFFYENNRTYDTWARIWPEGVLTKMEWSGSEEKMCFVEALEPVSDVERMIRSVSFHKDADDLDEEALRFYAETPDGSVREYWGLFRFQSPQTGNCILLFTNVPKRGRDNLELFASVYDPLQWRALGNSESTYLRLGELSNPLDWDEVLKVIKASDSTLTSGVSTVDSTHVALPKGSLRLLSKAQYR